MALNFGQILDAVCKDGIAPSRRGDAKEWVRNRQAMIWGAAPWTFKQKQAAITFTANQQAVAGGPADVQSVYALYDSSGVPVRGIRDIRKFFDLYNNLTLPTSGGPEAYTVLDGTIYVGPSGDGSTGLIVYEAQKPTLADDTDPTGLPDGFDLALVYGAKATGLTLANVQPLAGEFEQMFQAQVEALMGDYLDSVLETGGQSGAYKPGRPRAFR